MIVPRRPARGILGLFWVLALLGNAGLYADEPHVWIWHNSGTRQALNGITDNGTLFVAVGNSGTILTSPDAIAWTPQASLVKQDLNGVAWFHGNFVAVGNHGLILISHNGTAWAVVDSHTMANLHGVTASATILAAVGDKGTILLSATGEKWAAPSTPRFVPMGSNPPATTIAHIPSNPEHKDLNLLDVKTSLPEGPSNFRPAPPPPPLPDLFHIISTPTEFVIATEHIILTSTNGLVWTTVAAGSAKDTHPAVPAAGGRASPPASSADVGTSPALARRGGANVGLRAGARGMAGARRGAGARGAVPPPPPDALYSVAQSKALAVAVGDAGQIWTSAKVGSWSRLTSPTGYTFTQKLADVYWSGRHFISVGGDGAILSSINGEHWENVYSPTRENLAAVTGRPGLLVAVGANGTIVTNEDWPVASKPAISPAGGIFMTQPLITLSCATPGVTLHYTVNGLEPDVRSTTYDKPFLMPKPGQLRVRAFKDGMDTSLETSADFNLAVLPTITESSGLVRVPYPPKKNPGLAHFDVKTAGAIPPATFRWQRKPFGKDGWVDFTSDSDDDTPLPLAPGEKVLPAKTVPPPPPGASPNTSYTTQTSELKVRYDPSMNGDLFHCVVSNEAGSVISGEAMLMTFTPIPAAITKEPRGDNVLVGHTATFTVEAIGDPAPSYQWLIRAQKGEFKLGDGRIIHAVPLKDDKIYDGTQRQTLAVRHTTLAMTGEEFICVITNGYEGTQSLVTPWVDLQVWKPPPLISTQPASVVAPPGSIVNFIVGALVDNLPNFQWQCLTSLRANWEPIQDGNLYSGTKDGNLIVHYTTLEMSGYQYRCIVVDPFDENHQTSTPVTLTVRK